MTNKECKIKKLRQSWGDLLLEKERLITELLNVEYKLNLIKETLLRYGISQTNPGMGEDKTDMGESDHLDNCFACDSNTDVHKL